MNETDTKKTAPKNPPPAKAPQVPDLPKGIPVFVLRTTKQMQLPGYDWTDTVKTQTVNNGCSWEIEFIPQIRHIRISYTDPSRQDRCKTAFVHESQIVSWEPMT